MSINNKLIVVLTGAIAIATVVYTIVAIWTLREIHSGSADTHALAIAAKTQAEKMQSVSDAADKIRQAAEGMVSQDKRIADSAEQSFNASNRQSEANLRALWDDERAWVSATVTTGSSNGGIPQVGERFMIRIKFSNTGKTPAEDAKSCARSNLTDNQDVPETFDCDAPHSSISVIPPGSFHYADLVMTENLSAADRDAILQTKKSIWVFGWVTYNDVFRKPHRTDFCEQLLAGGGWLDCSQHNNMN